MTKQEESWWTYTWGNKRFVAFIDILGFKSVTNHFVETNFSEQNANSADIIFSLWRNCLPSRQKLSHSPNINFVQMSDSVVIYTEDENILVELVGDIFGKAIVFGVPIRGGLGYGIINHAEDRERPGTFITFYGDGIKDSVETEALGSGKGMRIFLSESFLKNSRIHNSKVIVRNDSLKEFRWWLYSGLELEHFSTRTDLWWTEKNVGKWFSGDNRKETKNVFKMAIDELMSKSNLES